MIEVNEVTNQPEWDQLVEKYGGHPLQNWGWGQLKSQHNWQALRLTVQERTKPIGGAQVLVRKLPWPFKSMAYVPRGPFAAKAQYQTVLAQLAKYLKDRGFIYLSIEPDLEELDVDKKWVKSKKDILIANTLIIDLTESEEQLLSRMSKKTRQYIRKSQKNCDEIRRLTDDNLPEVMEIYHQTAKRAGFGLHADKYYHDCAKEMGDRSLIFGAFKDKKLINFVWLAANSNTAFELYGGMNQEGQKLRTNYALKWQAIKYCQEQGMARYDLNGLLNDGISDFKKGFSDHRNQLVGTYDYVYKPFLYHLWLVALPIIKRLLHLVKR